MDILPRTPYWLMPAAFLLLTACGGGSTTSDAPTTDTTAADTTTTDASNTITYSSEGTSTSPIDVTNNLPYSGQVDTGSSYYVITVTTGKSYTVSLTDQDAPASLSVYDGDSSFTTTACTSNGTTEQVCRIEPAANNTLYIKVVGNASGARYTLNVSEIIYLAEGSQATPLLISSEPSLYSTPYRGQVDNVSSFYQFPVTVGAFYHIAATNLSGDIGLEVYDSDINTLLCSSNNANLVDESCDTNSATTGTSLYIVITGSTYGAGFDLSVDQIYSPEGNAITPKDITGLLPVSYNGETGAGIDVAQQSHYKISLTAGKSYRFSLTNFSHPDVALQVYDEDPTSYPKNPGCLAAELSGSYVCTITPLDSVSGVVNLRVSTVNSLYGASFTLNIEEIAYQNEGTVDNPIAIGNFPVADSNGGIVLKNDLLSYNGEAGVGSSYYVADISGAYDYVGYKINLVNQGTEAVLYIYADAGFITLLCSATNYGGTADKTCAFDTTGNQLYIRVDGSPSGFGAVYTLEVDADYRSEGTPVKGRGTNNNRGALQLALGTPHPGEAGKIKPSYYQLPVTAGLPYTIGLSNLFNPACISTYPNDDGRFKSTAGPSENSQGLNDKTITVTPISDVLYFTIKSCSTPTTNGTAYTIEVNQTL